MKSKTIKLIGLPFPIFFILNLVFIAFSGTGMCYWFIFTGEVNWWIYETFDRALAHGILTLVLLITAIAFAVWYEEHF